jgi:glycosyltransferase involved in cell wall biosynthesis
MPRASRRARIFFVNRFFHPDVSATSQMTSDLAFALAAEGFAVTALCSRLRYDDAMANLPRLESQRGVEIRRVRSTRFGRHWLPGRMLDFLSFYVSAWWHLVRELRRGDVVIAETDPPLIALVAATAAWFRGARLVNWLQDLFPEVATELGANPLPGWLDRYLRAARNLSLRFAHDNVVLGTRMRDYVLRQGVEEQRVTIIENWADGEAVRPVMSQDTVLRARLALGRSFIVAYSGNLGRAHEYATLLGAARALQDDDHISFLMTGGGAGMQELQAEVRRLGMGNFLFLPYQPRETLADCLGTGDVHLVSLRPELEGLIVPSKFYGILAAGRPTVFIGDPEGELSNIIRRFDVGCCVASGDGAALAARLRELQQQPARRELMALRSRALFDSHYTLPRAVREWSSLLRKIPPVGGLDALEQGDARLPAQRAQT